MQQLRRMFHLINVFYYYGDFRLVQSRQSRYWDIAARQKFGICIAYLEHGN